MQNIDNDKRAGCGILRIILCTTLFIFAFEWPNVNGGHAYVPYIIYIRGPRKGTLTYHSSNSILCTFASTPHQTYQNQDSRVIIKV